MASEIKIKLNAVEKIEQVLQESYDLTCKEINEIQNEMNKLTNSTPLVDVPMDDKAKYAKAMHDFISDKTKAINQKVDIAKLMAEVMHHNGNVNDALSDPSLAKNTKLDLNALRKEISNTINEDAIVYNTKSKD